MNVQPKKPTTTNPVTQFVGDAWFEPVADAEYHRP